jgi:hypothetical protein
MFRRQTLSLTTGKLGRERKLSQNIGDYYEILQLLSSRSPMPMLHEQSISDQQNSGVG